MNKLNIVAQEDNEVSVRDKRLMIELKSGELRFGFFDKGETRGRLIATAMNVPVSGRMLIYAVPGMVHYNFAKYPGGPKAKSAPDLTPAKINKGNRELVSKYFPFIPKDTVIYWYRDDGNKILK
jgi:hypothetical protein